MSRLEALLQPWCGVDDRRTPTGTLLIHAWEAEGPRAFLHELYPPISQDGRSLVRNRLEFGIPQGYDEFLSANNGARLFLNTVSFGGVVQEIQRGTNLDEAQPVSLIDELDIFAAVSPQRWDGGWRRIGKVTINNQWSIELSPSGKVCLDGDQGRRVFPDIWTCVDTLVDLLAPSFAKGGRQSESWDEIDQRLVGLVR